MANTTYRKLAELIRDTYHKGKASDDAVFSLRYFAEMIVIYVAEAAYFDAINNSNNQESTYSNGQFISTFKNIPIQDVDGEKFSNLPATPTSLPNSQEIVSVEITGSKCLGCIPMKAHTSFTQQLLGLPYGMVLYVLEGSKITYKTTNPLLEGSATIKMIGALSGDDLLTSDLNIPKNYEAYIMDKIMAKLLPMKNIPQDNLNNGVSNPA